MSIWEILLLGVVGLPLAYGLNWLLEPPDRQDWDW